MTWQARSRSCSSSAMQCVHKSMQPTCAIPSRCEAGIAQEHSFIICCSGMCLSSVPAVSFSLTRLLTPIAHMRARSHVRTHGHTRTIGTWSWTWPLAYPVGRACCRDARRAPGRSRACNGGASTWATRHARSSQHVQTRSFLAARLQCILSIPRHSTAEANPVQRRRLVRLWGPPTHAHLHPWRPAGQKSWQSSSQRWGSDSCSHGWIRC